MSTEPTRIAPTSPYCKRRDHRTCTETWSKPCGCRCHGDEEDTMPATPALRPVPDALPGGMVWEDPPESQQVGRPALWSPAVMAALKAHPGRWAKIHVYKSKSGAWAAARTFHKKPVDGFEAEGRSLVGGGSALYMRAVDVR